MKYKQFYGAVLRGPDGKACKFKLGDKVRLKGTVEPVMIVTGSIVSHPTEPLESLQCEYVGDHGTPCHPRHRIDELEMVEAWTDEGDGRAGTEGNIK